MEELCYKVWETPWPYPSSFNCGVAIKTKYFLGQISILIINKLASKHGNRFLYKGKLKATSQL